MRFRLLRTSAVIGVLLLFLSAPAWAGQKKRPWQRGSLLAFSASGYGKTDRRRGDLWWEYCIEAGGRTYTAALRRSPTKMGLAVGDPVRFALAGNRIYVLDKNGREQVMHLQSRDNESDCNPRPPDSPAPPPWTLKMSQATLCPFSNLLLRKQQWGVCRGVGPGR